MKHVTYDVVLVTDDVRLREDVRRACPDGGRLLCLTGKQRPDAEPIHAHQWWTDLDTAIGSAPDTNARCVFFRSRGTDAGVAGPRGIFVRKPCRSAVLNVLWAGAISESIASAARAASVQTAEATVPAWLLDLHAVSLTELGNVAVTTLPRHLGYRFGTLYIADAEQRRLTLVQTSDPTEPEIVIELVGDPRHPLAEYALRNRIARVQLQQRIDADVLLPLRFADTLEGLLALGGPIDGARTDDARLDLVRETLARSFHNARLYQRSRHEARVDRLTGLYNDRWLRESLEKEIRRAQRFDQKLSVMLIDLDNLKEINDTHGHTAGDCVLRHVATRIAAGLRQIDSAARLGGDEFVVVLPAADLFGAQNVGQRILSGIRESAPTVGDATLPVTVSLGAAEWQAGWNVERLLDAADRAMYVAKNQGRDRLVFYSHDTDHEPNHASSSLIAIAPTRGTAGA